MKKVILFWLMAGLASASTVDQGRPGPASAPWPVVIQANVNTATVTPTYTFTPTFTGTNGGTPNATWTWTNTMTPTNTPTPTAAQPGPGYIYDVATNQWHPRGAAAPSMTPTNDTAKVDDARNNDNWQKSNNASLNLYGPNILFSPTFTPTGTLTPSNTPTCIACVSGVVPVTSSGGITLFTPLSRISNGFGTEFVYSSALSSGVTYGISSMINGQVQTASSVALTMATGVTSNYLGYVQNNAVAIGVGYANGFVIKPTSVPSATQTLATLTVYMAFFFSPMSLKNAPPEQYFAVYRAHHGVREDKPFRIVQNYNAESDYSRAARWAWQDYLFGS